MAEVDVFGPDPFVDWHLRELLGPTVSPNFREWRLAEQRVLLSRIEALDGVLGDLTMERRLLLGRLQTVHRSLWRVGDRQVRRRPELDVAPVPPPVPGAEALYGAQLRAVCLMILERHLAMGLRDLHGYLHRYGYSVGGNRPVQRLADCMAFEVRRGRARRLGRGEYAVAVGGAAPAPAGAASAPAPWSLTPGDGDGRSVPVDPHLREMPERWQPSAWSMAEAPPPEDLEDDDRDEVMAVLATYKLQRRAAAKQIWGQRSARSFTLGSLAADSLKNRRQRGRMYRDGAGDLPDTGAGGWAAEPEEGEGGVPA
jgi:hypothetical protein